MTLTAFNNDPSATLPLGRVALSTKAAWSAAPQASGGSGALNITWLADAPMVYAGGGFTPLPLGLRLTISGTWLASTITVKSMSKGDEAISVAAGFTGQKLTTKTFLRPDIQAVITGGDPGPMAKLDIEWVYDLGAKPCAAGAKAADIAGVVTTSTGIAPRAWGRFGRSMSFIPNDNVAIELASGASVAAGTRLYLLADGSARDRRAGDTAGVDLGDCKATPLMLGGKLYAPFNFAPVDIGP